MVIKQFLREKPSKNIQCFYIFNVPAEATIIVFNANLTSLQVLESGLDSLVLSCHLMNV
jgi:hypothetical protein